MPPPWRLPGRHDVVTAEAVSLTRWCVPAMPPADNFKSDYKQRVLGAVDLVEMIGRTVSLKRAGKSYVGLCPFHSEKSPSFSVDPARQFFYCFGCKAKGNAIDFVMRRDRLEFLDAMRLLGDAAGVERPNTTPHARQAAGQRQQLLDACSTAAACFQKLLAHPTAGAPGRAYLAERGFKDDAVQRFQIGLAADAWDALLRADAMRPFGPAVLTAAGLVKPRENGGGYYDTFRNRLMFPIRDESGRVIAFGGRVMPGSADKAKYLNSPETPLFNKGKVLFGLDLGRQRIVESRTVAVVEGYADVVMAHQYGATNVVSPLGTALTESHVSILRRFADRIVLLFDADSAGDAAVNRAVELFLTQPVEIAIASLPDGMDPDEYLLAHGAEAFDGVLKGAADALTFTWRQLDRQFRASTDMTGRQKAVQQYLGMLSAARKSGPVDDLRWGSALARVQRLTDIPMADLHRMFSPAATAAPVAEQQPQQRRKWEPRKPYNPFRDGGNGDGKKFGGKGKGPFGWRDEPPRQPPAASVRTPSAREASERRILAVLLAEPHRWHGLVGQVGVSDFTDAACRPLAAAYWQHQQDEGEPVFNEFLGVLAEASTPPAEDGSGAVDLADLAAGLMAEFNGLTGGETPITADALLADALAYLAEMRAGGERDKLVADLRRNSGVEPGPATATESLRQLQERARRPDLRRVGS